VADHGELLSVSRRMRDGDPKVMATPSGRWMREVFTQQGGAELARKLINAAAAPVDLLGDLNTPPIRQDGWDDQVDAAERYNEPGRFTAMIGWEWSSTPGALNLHRVVFTNAGGTTAKKFLPFNSYLSQRPEDLWSFFEETKARTGADFIAMPHNSNLSGGLMFDTVDSAGNPFTAAYASRRAMWEPVVEITQYKGTSETHPALAPTDEFAGFEIRDKLLTGTPSKADPRAYVRSALGRGLQEEARIGANPYRFGLIGASDSHSGFSSVQEKDFLGKFGEDLLPGERLAGGSSLSFPAWEMSAGGLAGVWADANTRQSIFDAFRRREVFATSGPRISLRLFAGYGFAPGAEDRRDFAEHGYRRGVPMGGVLSPARSGAAPQLLIRAVKDPREANLDRVQVVKGWLDASGTLREKIYDVAWSPERRMGPNGLPAVRNTVDLRTGRYANSVGAPELTALWRDPDFDPRRSSYYYVRVLQIPTPRHSLFDALALGIDPARTGAPATIQERAWSSPVWYRP
jgi:hypothetical protein